MLDTEFVPIWANLRRKECYIPILQRLCRLPCTEGLDCIRAKVSRQPWPQTCQSPWWAGSTPETEVVRLQGVREADGKVAHNPNDKILCLRTKSHTTATLNWQPSSPHLAILILLLILNFLSQNLAGDQAVNVEQNCAVLWVEAMKIMFPLWKCFVYLPRLLRACLVTL